MKGNIILMLAAGAGLTLGAATKCVTDGWPVASSTGTGDVTATLAAGGTGASTGAALETRFRTEASAENFALDTRPGSGLFLIIR